MCFSYKTFKTLTCTGFLLLFNYVPHIAYTYLMHYRLDNMRVLKKNPCLSETWETGHQTWSLLISCPIFFFFFPNLFHSPRLFINFSDSASRTLLCDSGMSPAVSLASTLRGKQCRLPRSLCH